MRCALLSLCLALAACGQSVPIGTNDDNQGSARETTAPEPVAVRIGELGPSLQACTAAGTTRGLEAQQSLPVRSAPFDNGEQKGAVRFGGRFFVCSRSLDQKWVGIVYDDALDLNASCGVSDSVPTRKAYDGPCRSGWVSSPFVKLIAGKESLLPANHPVPAGNGTADASGQ